ncbi:helix-turn-helix domain-containing protein [Actinoplanes friuliensis]|uniref:Putative DNA-binding protein n=1 Tax=Actinoplanes friuliensis DSM 7358 TaxID=1246995 RepID=U5W468_9ACTN|nr:helix-turn-helix transcriptional regulator [Actinoplanes friuliensis]AGZ42775.1 putative DNA-binding protein [Actinoplanes friuliensis DSM 7358]
MTPRPSADPTIGERIQARRLRRGWSIRHAASRAGLSHATWSRIERGRQAADNRFVLADIAGALECSPADLAGTAVPAADRAAAAAQAAVHNIRQALIDIDLTEPASRPAPPVAGPARTVALADTLRQACDYAGTARLLPGLLRDLHAVAAGPDRGPALRLLCDATFMASSVLRNLGHPADAWLGAERCREAADAADDPVLRGYAAYARAGAATACGSYARGLALASRAVDDLRRHTDRPGGTAMLGSLQLVCAYASRGLKRTEDSRAWTTEAAALAATTGETTELGMFFGPTNVGIWSIGIEVDGGDPERAAEIARTTNPATIPAGFRQVFYYADTARALARTRGSEREAVRFLLTAERLAPQHVHTSPLARETTRALLERSRRKAGGSELRGLSERMQVER